MTTATATTYPTTALDGRTVWACCLDPHGAPCGHRQNPDGTAQPVAVVVAPDSRWIVVERENGPDLVVGPYATEPDAVHAMENALLIDGFCEEDCTDCYTAGPDALKPAREVVLIDPDDTDHTAADVARD